MSKLLRLLLLVLAFNAITGSLFYVGLVEIAHHHISEWLSIMMAQGLGAMQVPLFVTIWSKP